VRRLIAGCILAVLAAGCSTVPGSISAGPGEPQVAPAIQVEEHPTPFAEITSGKVHALVPKQWSAASLEGEGTLRQGLVASPNLDRWTRMDGSVPGLEATWVDVARGGIPSDFYYLAARGAAVPRIATSQTCRAGQSSVIVNHRPAFAGNPDSLGDYAVRGTGRCRSLDGRPTRYAYFVAAPGYGPVRDVGISTSGLYVVVAVVPDNPDAAKKLHTMLMSARFNRTSVAGLVKAARASAQLR
jgi:hypothetical protein